uniref:Uncharacterized protein n=1 Tax=Anopheles maculatus TaxID=74869 RepID=A0A182SJU6_9DIPT
MYVASPVSRHASLPTEDRHARTPPSALLSRARRQLVYVRGQMLREVVGPGKTFAASLTVVRPLAGVDAQVARQVRFAAERAATEQTHKRPLAGVFADVQLQVFLRPDTLTTERAGEASVALLFGGIHAQKVQYGGFLWIEPKQPVVRVWLSELGPVEVPDGGRPCCSTPPLLQPPPPLPLVLPPVACALLDSASIERTTDAW